MRASTMATSTPTLPAEPPAPESGLFLRDVAWSEFEAMLQAVGDRHIRVTFDGEAMEVSMPSQRHEQAAPLLGLFVPRLAEELEVPYEPLGMTTWKKASAVKGLQAHQCYYIQNQAVVREKEALDLEIDPPPDLAIEVDITSSSLDRMGIYADLGVPEIWRFDGNSVTMYERDVNGRYQTRDVSRCFPSLRPADVERFLELGRRMEKTHWSRELRDWVREEFIPRAKLGEHEAL
jgi:Uma2 family endonuclease